MRMFRLNCMKHIWKLRIYCILFTVTAAAALCSCGTEPGDLNVILVTIDTLRADHMSCYGYGRNTTPNIDALALEGVLFEKATVNWPKTTPSMASMLTGTYGRTNGVIGGCRQDLPLELITVAEVMKKHSFATGAVVNNANLGREFQFDQGFDEHVEIWKKPPPADASVVTDNALDWLKRSGKKNFFLWVHYIAPHAVYSPPKPFNTMFLNDKIYLKTSGKKLPVRNTYEKAIHRKKAYVKPHRLHSYYVAQYDGEIAWVDSQFKRVIDHLKKSGLFDKTLLILTSDHGEELGEHDIYYEHGFNVYEATMHVPLIIVYPERIPGKKRIKERMLLVDLFPTIMDYVGISGPRQLEGRSLKPLIEGKSRGAGYLFSEGGYPHGKTDKFHTVVYSEPYKLIHKRNDKWEFYDLEKDPEEQEKLNKKKRHVFLKHRRVLQKWEQSHTVTRLQEKKEKTEKKLSRETEEQLKALGYVE